MQVAARHAVRGVVAGVPGSEVGRVSRRDPAAAELVFQPLLLAACTCAEPNNRHNLFLWSHCPQGFKPAPLVALRTCKADVVAGLAHGQSEALSAADADWLVNGKWGMVQGAWL